LDRKTFVGCLIALLALDGCSGSKLVVGSKDFTEQLILGEIIAQHLENRLHKPVVRRLGLGGMLTHQALLGKDIDIYPEYTGTAFTNVLKHSGVSDPAVVLDRVRSEYQSSMGIEWLDPLGFNNAFAMVVRGDEARSRHLETLSDAAADTTGFVLGAGYEFMSRQDGFPALNAAYNIKWNGAPKSMNLGLLYTALTQFQITMAAGSTTDGTLKKLDAKILQDDKHVFPPYQACILVRAGVFEKHPEVRKILLELSGKISDDVMRGMNYTVDGEHRQPAEVAREFLQKAGLH
jgi:osmoprotectant transport system substrate-binding protein